MDAATLEAARAQGPVLAWGAFVTNVINFLILAFVVFLLVKAVNKARREEPAPEVETEAAPPADVQLLGEIRDLLTGGPRPGTTGADPANRTPPAGR